MVENVCLLCLVLVVVVGVGKVQQLVMDMTKPMTNVVLVNVRLAGMLSCMVRIACFVMLLVRRLL